MEIFTVYHLKLKLSLCLTEHHTMTYCGSRSIAPRILDLSTRWRWVVGFTPRPLCPQGKSPGIHWIGCSVGLRAVLDAVVKTKIPSPRRESRTRTPIVQPIAQRYTDRAITAVVKVKVKLSLYLTEHHAMKTYWGCGGIAPRILDLGTRWRWVVSCTPRPLCIQGKSPLYPLDRNSFHRTSISIASVIETSKGLMLTFRERIPTRQ
jgi:hypothetical protein